MLIHILNCKHVQAATKSGKEYSIKKPKIRQKQVNDTQSKIKKYDKKSGNQHSIKKGKKKKHRT